MYPLNRRPIRSLFWRPILRVVGDIIVLRHIRKQEAQRLGWEARCRSGNLSGSILRMRTLITGSWAMSMGAISLL